MRIGYHLTPFWSPTERGPTRIIDEAIEVIGASSTMGYEWVSIGHHQMSYPTVWPQPFPFLARIAPVTGDMKLKTSVLLLPLLSAVDVAENVATLDHISHGRFVLGIAIGYREAELQAVGLTRKDRAPKMVESIEVMKRLWSGQEVTFRGKYPTIEQGRMGFSCYQQPHPPIEFGGQSEGATRRAAQLGDGIFFGPQVPWADIPKLCAVYKEARQTAGKPDLGALGASRSLIVGKSKQDALERARQYLEKTFRMYNTWSMQERNMVQLQLSFDQSPEAFAIVGSPSECVETILRGQEMGLNSIGFTIYSLPPEPDARIDYLQMIAEEIVNKVRQ
jgi:alkanesulfonate monooxygenase SsuD/methylene tetrahydromethanopterin reductase-like flavin-dependent oxidoreductase (luciferase family)